jgi:hypothetical protein
LLFFQLFNAKFFYLFLFYQVFSFAFNFILANEICNDKATRDVIFILSLPNVLLQLVLQQLIDRFIFFFDTIYQYVKLLSTIFIF